MIGPSVVHGAAHVQELPQAVIGVVAALGTIAMTIGARFDTISTVALVGMHVVITATVIIALAVARLRHPSPCVNGVPGRRHVVESLGVAPKLPNIEMAEISMVPKSATSGAQTRICPAKRD